MAVAAATLQAEQTEPRVWLQWFGTTLLLVVMAGSVSGFINWLANPENSPLREISIKGEFQYLDRLKLQQTLAPMLKDGFFKVDVAAIQARAETLPWVDQATVRRVWRDRLEIIVTEQQPAARWGEAALLNQRGESFVPGLQAVGMALPLLSGPEGHSQSVLAAYRQMSGLLTGLGLNIDELHQDARRSWRLTLSNNMSIELGRTEPRQRLARFIHAYPAILATSEISIEAVDLRYSNGFAVRWKQQES